MDLDLKSTNQPDPKLFKLLAESNQDIIWLANLNLDLIYVNPAVLKYLGFLPNDLINNGLSLILPVRIINILVYLINKKLKLFNNKTYSDLTIELDLLNKNSKKIRCVISATFIFDNEKSDVLIGGYVKEINERHNTKLKYQKLKYDQHLIDNSISDAVWSGVLNVDNKEFEFTFLSPVFGKITGFEFDSSTPFSSITNIIHEEDKQIYNDRYVRILNEEINFLESDYRIVKKDGSIGWIRNKITINRIDKNHKQLFGVISEVTDKIRTQFLLKQSEEKFRLLFDTSPDGIVLIDTSGKILSSNKAFDILIQTKEDEHLVGSSFIDLFPPNLKVIDSDFLESIIYDSVSGQIETELNTKSGNCVPVLMSAWIMNQNHGSNDTIGIFIHDISSQKQIHESLMLSEERYRTLAQLTTDAASSLIINPDGTFNREWVTQSLNSSLTPILKNLTTFENWAKIVHPDDLESYKKAVKNIMKGQTVSLDFRIISPDGQVIWINNTVQPEMDYVTKKTLRLVSAIKDITDRKIMEELVKENEEKYRTLFESELDSILIIDVETNKIIDANISALFTYGYSKEEITRLKYDNITDDNLTELDKINSGIAHIKLTWHRKSNGSLFPAEINTNSVTLKGKKYLILAIRDISDRINTEKSLKESEEKFRNLAEYTSDWVWETDITGKFLYSNFNTYDLFGYQIHEILGKHFFSFMPASESKKFQKKFRQFVDNKSSFRQLENKILHKSGKIKTLQTSGVPVFDNDKNLVGFRGVTRDITDQKYLEIKLRYDEARFKTLFTLSQMINLPEDQIINFAVLEAVRLSQSNTCYIFRFMQPSGRIILYTGIEGSTSIKGFNDLDHSWHPDEFLFFSIPVNNRVPLIVNNLEDAHLTRERIPIKLDNVLRLMNIPVIVNGQIEMIISLFNKNEDYSEFDSLQVNLLFDGVHRIIIQKRILDSLNERKRLLQSVVSNIPVIVASISTDGTLKLLEGQGLSKFGIEPKVFIGTNLRDYIIGYPDVIEIVNLALDGQAISQIINIKNIYMDIRVTPQMNEKSEIIGAIGILIDVTENKHSEILLKENEEKYRQLFELESDAIILIDARNHKILNVNAAGQKLYGYSKREFMSKFDFELLAHQLDKDSKNHFRSPRITIEHKRKDGSIFPVEIVSSTFTWHGSHVIVAAIRDITEQKKAEEKLIMQKSLFEAVAQASQLLLIRSDYNLAIVETLGILGKAINLGRIFICENFYDEHLGKYVAFKRYEWLSEYVKENVNINTLKIYTHDDFLNRFDKLSNGEIMVTRISDENSGELNYLVSQKAKSALVIPIMMRESFWGFVELNDCKYERFWTEEEISFLMAFASSIGSTIENKITAENLVKAKEVAESSSSYKGEFLANMSHEIRTPMNAILGFSELLLNKITDNQQQKYLSIILASGRSLLALINDILDLSKIESGKLDLQYKQMNIEKVLAEINSIFSQRIEEKNLEFYLDISNNLPKVIYIDEVRFRQILFNLVGNAIKFTDKGFIKVTAYHQYQDSNRVNLTVIVQDSGIGIPEEQHSIIFEAFRQQSGQSTRKYGGTGLGLAITKRLAEGMNGYISLESQVGVGSKFQVVFYDIVISEKEELLDDSTDNSILDLIFEPSIVFLVDDLSYNRELVRGYLEGLNLSVIEIASGEEAISMLEMYQPNLIIMDIIMPGMDGKETSKIIRNNPKFNDIPIIAFTALSGNEKDDLITGLYNGFLRKPVNRNELIKELCKFLPSHPIEMQEEIKQIHHPSAKVAYSEQKVNYNVKNIKEFIGILQDTFVKDCENLKEFIVLDEIEDFARRLVQISQQYNANMIIDYAENLLELAQTYDVDRIRKGLNNFYKIIDTISMTSQ